MTTCHGGACRGLLALGLAVSVHLPLALAAEPNYDEAAVRAYTLPDVLVGPAGTAATTADEWQSISRPHQFALLEKSVYGQRLPAVPVSVVGDVDRADVTLADGVEASRLQARMQLGDHPAAMTTDVLLYLPKQDRLSKERRPVPVFLHLNFRGNQAEHPDPGIRLCEAWLPDDPKRGVSDHRATADSRAKNADRWPVEKLLARGYGVATACYGDVYPDRADGRAASALALLRPTLDVMAAADEPGAIATWAWQLSRILDWLITLPEVDAKQVIVVGHSRNGKAAVWAGACDERFAMVVSNESGCGGAALERRNYGETVEAITRRFPHWFCPAFASYADRETDLPVDAHVTLAMTAPRPLYVASAIDDRWADPKGEFLAAVAAGPVWKLFGLEGLGTTEWPLVETPVGHTIGYHVRAGKHDLLADDWLRFADFADRTLRENQSSRGHAKGAFQPVQEPLPAPPPPGAIVLFGDGTEPEGPKFTSMAGGPIDWTVADGTLVVGTSKGHTNHIVSVPTFRDADIHAEFITSPIARGNSGLYIHGHYEMQIFDSAGVEPPTDQDEGALYRFGPPLVNAARQAGEWQVYDIRFIAPRRGPDGAVTTPGRITAWLNGTLVQDGIEFAEPRSPYIPYRHGVTDHLRSIEATLRKTGSGPLFLQDHGSPVRYRNVWIRPLDP